MTGKVQFNLNFIPAPLARGVDHVLHIWRHCYGLAQPCSRGLELVSQLYYKVLPESALCPSPGILHVLRFLLAVNTHASQKLLKSTGLTQAQRLWKGPGLSTSVGNEGLVSFPGSESTSLKHQTTDLHL